MSDIEAARLKLLHALQVLDTPPEPVFDRITRLLAQSLDVPIALVSLIDGERQWFKSVVGLDVRETPREIAFCAHAILGHETLVVEDATMDARFCENPLVTAEPHIRFYAGAPIRSRDGLALGTLCAIDARPRALSAEQHQLLRDLADIATHEFQRRESVLDTPPQVSDDERFERLFGDVGVGIARISPAGRWLQVNDALLGLVGRSREALSRFAYTELTAPEERATERALLQRLALGEFDRYELEKRCLRDDGSSIWVSCLVTGHADARGELDSCSVVITDIDARKRTEAELSARISSLEGQVQLTSQQLRAREVELSAIIDYTNDAYVSMDSDSRVTAWNQTAESLFGWSREEAMGQPMHEMIIPEHLRQRHLDGMKRFIETGEQRVLGARVELDALRKDGSTVPVEVHINALKTDDKIMFNAFLHEISQRKQREASLRKEALHDPLTDLPNRRALHELLPLLIQQARSSGSAFAVMFLDLDGFKQVNDSHGHDVGDELLRQVATRLRQSVRASDHIHRLAGDEFTLLLHPIDNRSALDAVAGKLLATIRPPFSIDGTEVLIRVSIGITLFRDGDERSPHQLIKDADAAMYQAKQQGRDRHCYAARDLAREGLPR